MKNLISRLVTAAAAAATTSSSDPAAHVGQAFISSKWPRVRRIFFFLCFFSAVIIFTIIDFHPLPRRYRFRSSGHDLYYSEKSFRKAHVTSQVKVLCEKQYVRPSRFRVYVVLYASDSPVRSVGCETKNIREFRFYRFSKNQTFAQTVANHATRPNFEPFRPRNPWHRQR